MGLTIHYTLKLAAKTTGHARALVGQLHDYARKLPFAEAGEIVEFQGADDCDCEQRPSGDPSKWLLIQATHLNRLVVDGKEQWQAVTPQHLIAFSINPGDGCEQANLWGCAGIPIHRQTAVRKTRPPLRMRGRQR